MRFVFADISNVLGLQGSINFSKPPVLLYGKNLAGKTNMINLIRYCFVSGKAGKKYAEEKRLNKDELLLGQSNDGKATFYFEHKSKLFKLEFQFRRTSNTVNQKIYLYEASGFPNLSKNAEDGLSNLEWMLMASNSSQLKEKFGELGIYSDVIDILISPSNVRNFTEAINNELVTIPDIIAKQISNLHKGSEKLIGNLQKLQGILVQEKETYQHRLGELKREFEKESSKSPKEIAGIFVLGRMFTNLDEQLKSADQELTRIPSTETQLLVLQQKWASEFRDKLQKIADAKAGLQEKNTIIKQKEELSTLTKDFETVKTWSVTFKTLPSKDNIQALTDFEIPSEKAVDSQRFFNPQKIQNIFELLKKAKNDLKGSLEIARKYNVTLALGEVRSLAASFKKLEKAVKSPQDKPEGDEVVILYSEEDKQSEVYIPIDAFLANPNYIKGIKETPLVFRTKDLSEKELEKLIKEIKSKADDLEECRNKLSSAIENIDQTKQLLPSLADEVEYLQNKKKDAEKNLTGLLSKWQTTSKVLTDTFRTEPLASNLDTVEDIKEFASSLHTALKKIETKFISELKQALSSAGIEVPPELNIKGITSIEDLLAKQSAELSAKRERLQKIKDWISSNLNEIREIEDRLLTTSLTETAILVLNTILQKIQDYTNLEAMSEQIAQSIEENVRRCVEIILPEEMVVFRHVGQGNFLVETINGKPITHPAGSHKAIISLGIMLTLSKLFDLPVILDEATDRFDYLTLRNTFQFINMLSTDDSSPQICLVSYKTLNIERNQEILDIIKNWNIYILERQDKLSKEIISVADVDQILH